MKVPGEQAGQQGHTHYNRKRRLYGLRLMVTL